jgi:anti-sigma regulatory factor (Ser/Thr protein kinase)
MASEDFTTEDLPRIRQVVRAAAYAVGLSVTQVDHMVLAVSEIAANALRYAGGCGRILVKPACDGLRVEISDTGPGLPAGLGRDRPVANAMGGRGLWLAQHLCRLSISSSDNGVTIRMFMPNA